MEKSTITPEPEENYEDNSDFELEMDEDLEQLQHITVGILRAVFKNIKDQEVLDLNGSDL
jgi:hypothetical protein